jgi:Terminase large subunit, T4likevirus-type, N-terminal
MSTTLTRLRRAEARLDTSAATEVDPADRERLDWFADSCPCGVAPGECRTHPRARPSQRQPLAVHHVWVFTAGRGAGKTEAGSRWIHDRVQRGLMKTGAIIAPTAADIRDVIVQGPSGLMATAPPWSRPAFCPSLRQVRWPSGAKAILLSGEEPERCRGLNVDTLWCDELPAWQRPQQTWDLALLALRIGEDPRALVTSTPRNIAVFKRILSESTTAITRDSTRANKMHLSPAFLEAVVGMFGGTRFARQELEGELVETSEAIRFPTWDPARHVTPSAEWIPGRPVSIAIDCGLSRHVGALWYQTVERDKFRRIIRVFADYYAVDKTSEANALAILARSREVCRGVVDAVYLDPASTARSGVGPAARAEFARVLGERITAVWPLHRVNEGLDMVEILLGGPDREPDLIVHPRCKFLAESFGTYRWAVYRDEVLDKVEDPQHPAEEAIDSLRGAIRIVYPEGRVEQPNLRQVSFSRLR